VAIVFVTAVVGLAVARSGQTSGGSALTAANVHGVPSVIPTSEMALNLTPRQAIHVNSYVTTRAGHTIVGLGLANVSPTPATVLVSLKGHLPLTRAEVWLNRRYNPGEAFRDGTITVPLPPNHTPAFWNLELTLPKGSSGFVQIDLVRDFGKQGTPSSEIAAIGFHP